VEQDGGGVEEGAGGSDGGFNLFGEAPNAADPSTVSSYDHRRRIDFKDCPLAVEQLLQHSTRDAIECEPDGVTMLKERWPTIWSCASAAFEATYRS
jgi:hypothetical protein